MRLVIGGDEPDLAARAVMVDQPVVRETVEIGRELRRRRVARASTNQIHPHILEELIDRDTLAALAQQITIDAAFVARVKSIERGRVAGGVSEHQVFVAGRGGGGHGPPSMRAGSWSGKRGPANRRRPRSC
jgi:hypothetical protein